MGKRKQSKARRKGEKKSQSKRKETKIFMPKDERSKKTGRVEAYTYGEVGKGSKWPF